MALLFFEGFETYGSLTGSALEDELIKKWSESTGGTIATGRDGGNRLTLSGNTLLEYNPQQSIDDWVIGFAFQINDSNDDLLVTFMDGQGKASSNFHFRLVNADTVLRAFANSDFSTPDTSADVLTYGQWHYIEIKLNIHPTTGSYTVKVDGVTQLSNTGLETDSGGTGANIQFWSSGVSSNVRLDDMYFCDNTGAQNNDFLGDSSVVAINPTSDVTIEWGSTGAAHYTEIDDNPSDEDTSYIETGSPSSVDLFDFENVTSLFGAIYGIQVCTELSSTSDATDLRVVSGVTTSDAEGTDNTVDNDPSFITFTRIVELDPNTSSAWTLSNLNAAQFGAIIGS